MQIYKPPMQEDVFRQLVQDVIDRALHGLNKEDYVEELRKLNDKFTVDDDIKKALPPQGSQISPPNEKSA